MKLAAKKVHRCCIDGKLRIAFAESCTGGLAAAGITALPGSSGYFTGSLVVYSNSLKVSALKVPKEILETSGAVSPETARSMVLGLRDLTQSDICISVTGVAGPDGGTQEKPLGLVWFGWSDKRGTHVWKRNFKGSRQKIQGYAVLEVYQAILSGPPVDS